MGRTCDVPSKEDSRRADGVVAKINKCIKKRGN